jgi:hypothetical protein
MQGAPGVVLEADHVIPWVLGGRTHVDNGQALCTPHNRRKASKYPTRMQLARLAMVRRSYFDDRVPDPRRPGRGWEDDEVAA